MFNKNLQKNKGFTLVETLVAIAILSMSVLGTFTAVQSGLSKSGFARDQVTAYYLIQESMEFVRNTRDQNQLKSIGGVAVPWLTGISNVAGDFCYFGKYCYLDSPLLIGSSHFATCTTSNDFNSCPVIKLDSATGLFNYSSGTNTRFKRAILIQHVGVNNDTKEVMVTIRVDWTSGVIQKSLQVSEWLYNLR